MRIPWRKHIPFLVILTAFVTLAVAYSVVNPLYESTDEAGHFRYIEYLRLFQRLPAPRTNGVLIQSHHPPLFHVAAALVSAWVPRDRPWNYEPEINPHWAYRYWETGADNKNQFMHQADEEWPYRGATLAIHVVRWFNVVLGALTVWLTYRLARTIFPKRRALALGATAFVAFNPMFLHLSGGINNDVAAGLMSTAILLVCMWVISPCEGSQPSQGLRCEIQLGMLLGLALLTKFNLLALLPVIEIALAVAAYRQRSWRAFVRANLIVLGLATLIAGWWYLRNLLLYGEVSGVGMMSREWGGERVPSQSIGLALSEMPYLWTSLWGRFGYGQIPLSDALYTTLFVFVIASLPGLALTAILAKVPNLRKAQSLSPKQVLQLSLLGLCLLLFWLTVFVYATLSVNAAMGRFLFPALASFGVLVFLGWAGWVPSRWEGGLAIGVNMALAALAVYCLFGVLAPAYARPSPLTERQIAAITHPTQAVYGGQVRLLGYDVNTDHLKPGDEFILTAYWQALTPSARDLTLFVHLLSREGPVAAQRDTYPGLGRFPASSWRPGDTFSDRYRIVLDPHTYAPDTTDVMLGMYIPGSGRLPVTDAAGHDMGTALTLTQATIAGLEGAYPNPGRINFDNKLALVGYALSARSVQASQTITLTLYWQLLQPVTRDYSVFAHVLGGIDQRWAANDGFPYVSPKRTRRWTVGQVYQDARALQLEPSTPPGIYPIELGLYGDPGGNRLAIVGADGRRKDEFVLLTQIRVTAPTPSPTATSTQESTSKGPSAGETRTRPADGAVMVYVPAGEFKMGSTEGDSDEQPVRLVNLDGFWIDRTEVTNARFATFLNERGNQVERWVPWLELNDEGCLIEQVGNEYRSKDSHANHPVVAVSWFGAAAYCKWAGARLPTEAEWEYAARGPQGYAYPWGNTFDGARLNFCDANCPNEWKNTDYDDGYARTAPVGSFPAGASWCGALDMAGNVWEWVNDWYDKYPSTAQTNPAGPATGDVKALRGGSWDYFANWARSANRHMHFPAGRTAWWGFRCAASSTP